jgi:soluble cytochrome b562
LQRGVLTTEMQHIKRTKLTVTSRLRVPTKMFIRHTVGKGWTLLDSPKSFERIGDAHLFEIELAPGQQKTVEIAEATPMERTMDLSAQVTLDLMKIYVQTPQIDGELKTQLKALLGIHHEIADLSEKVVSLRKKLQDYRERMDELHVQLLSLQAVKTGGDLLKNLRGKMKDISDRVQATTIAVVDADEKIMLSKIRFADALAEMKLVDVTAQR